MAGAVAGGFLGRFLCGLITDALGWRVAFASLAGETWRSASPAAAVAAQAIVPRPAAAWGRC
ncbi:MAG: hypothetical protein U1E33_04030 [Rhodospirillales bacterium]